jgi:DNA-binding FrmR family transcriptional regulator
MSISNDKNICEYHKKEIEDRLNKIAGQLKGISRMVADDKESLELLSQITSAKAALSKVGIIVVEHHMLNCFQNPISQESLQDSIRDLKSLLNRFIK